MRRVYIGAYIAYTQHTQSSSEQPLGTQDPPQKYIIYMNEKKKKKHNTENTSEEKGFIKPSENTIQFQFGDKHGVA